MSGPADPGTFPNTATSTARLTDFSVTLYVNKADPFDRVNFVNVESLYDDIEPNITLTTNVTDSTFSPTSNGTVTISGNYSNTYKDKFYYVSKNSSDKLEELQVAIGYNNLPVDHTLIRLEQDDSTSINRQYKVTWGITTFAGFITVTGTQTVTQSVTTNNDAIKTLIGEYYASSN